MGRAALPPAARAETAALCLPAAVPDIGPALTRAPAGYEAAGARASREISPLAARLVLVTVTGETVSSSVTDVSDVPLGAEVNIDGEAYSRIMRRLGLADGEQAVPVSAFNSSI